MVELRKRKAAEAPAPPPLTKRPSSVKSTTSKGKAAATEKKETSANGAASRAVGDAINLDDFGGEVETNEGDKTTLKKLVQDSESGVVLFTYPKASTPGCRSQHFSFSSTSCAALCIFGSISFLSVFQCKCTLNLTPIGTTQACLFRDDYQALTATGFAIYGLSTDSPKSNTTFKTKQNLPYTLLCDPPATLIAAIGMKKAPKGTTRGVFVVGKEGKVLAAEAGVGLISTKDSIQRLTYHQGPAATVEVVRKLVGNKSGGTIGDADAAKYSEKVEKETGEGNTHPQESEQTTEANGEKSKAEVAAEVADSAQKLDAGVEA